MTNSADIENFSIEKMNEEKGDGSSQDYSFLQSKYMKWAIFAVLLIAIFVSEVFWRNSLFDSNNNVIPDFQKRSSASTIEFFKVMTVFGQEQLMIPLTFLILLFFPLQSSFSLLNCVLYSTLWTNLLKGVYGQERPFWVNPNITNYSCEGGFGNPSGHSFSSAAFYMSLCFILTEKTNLKQKSIIYKILLYVFFCLLIVTILISRTLLGVHSINQVLFGGLLGLMTFYLIFFCISFHSMSSEQFSTYFNNLPNFLLFLGKYLLMFLGLLLVYLFIDFDTTQYDKVLNKLCPDEMTKSTFSYNNNNFNSGITFFALIGAHFGIAFIFYVLRNKSHWLPQKFSLSEAANFNQIECPRWLYMLLIFALSVGPIFGFFAISSRSSLGVVFLFKGIIPFLLIGFCAFGLAPFLVLRYVKKAEKEKDYDEPQNNDDA